MQAVILAAGSSTRTYPLTLTKPKPLLKIAGKTILEHNLDKISEIADEIIIVVGYKKEMIFDFFKNKKYKNIKFIEQKEQKGTANALMQVKDEIKGKFVLMMGDDLYPKDAIKKCVNHDRCVLAQKVKNPGMFGVFVLHNGKLWDVVEKPQMFVSDLANTAFYVFDKSIFDFIEKVKESKRGEYELTDALKEYARALGVDVEITDEWISIGYPWDLLKADKKLRKEKSLIGKNCKIDGEVENCFIDDGVIIEENAVVKDSIIYKNSIIKKYSIVEDSVIGENVVFSGKVFAEKNARSLVGKNWVTAERVGAIIADNVITENAEIKAGVKIWPNKKIEGKISEDIHD